MGLGLVDKLDCDFAKSRKQAVGQKTHDTLAYHLFMMRTDGAEGYGWTLFKNLSARWHVSVTAAAAWPYSLSRLYSCKCVCVSVYALLRE